MTKEKKRTNNFVICIISKINSKGRDDSKSLSCYIFLLMEWNKMDKNNNNRNISIIFTNLHDHEYLWHPMLQQYFVHQRIYQMRLMYEHARCMEPCRLR